jgi:serine/threonine protein kinase
MSPSPPETRASLILRLPNPADAAARDEFVAIYAPLVFRLGRKQGLQPSDSDDLVQEVLTSVARSVREWLDRDDEWQEAREVLSGLGLASDKKAFDVGYGSSPLSRSSWPRRSVEWSESMADQLLSPASHPELLGRIGRYDVERVIGSGGMGVVFKAFDTELNRPVAVKVLVPHLAHNGAARQRFAREARAAAAVVHEHVVPIHNVESDATAPFLVMPFVAGESLQQRIDREGALHVCEILRIAMQTASGLAAAHAQGLIHRDVKPSNILLEQGVERALLTDFGLARATDDASLTHTGCHPGTPQYMSPEQARGDSLDGRSDLFSLGSVVYTMCAGHPPFRAESSYAILRRITDTEPRPLREINVGIPDWLERLVNRLLAKNPDDRVSSAEQAANLLQGCLAHVQQPTVVDVPAELSAKDWPPNRIRLKQILFVCTLVVALLCGIYGVRQLAGLLGGGDDSIPSAVTPDRPVTVTQTDDIAPTSDNDDSAKWSHTADEIANFSGSLSTFETRTEETWDNSHLEPME